MDYYVNDLLKDYVSERRSIEYSDNTIDRIVRTLEMFCKDTGISKVSELSTDAILLWGDTRLIGGYDRKPLSDSGLYACYNSIRSFLIFLEEKNIHHDVERDLIKHSAKYKRRRPLRYKDIKVILNYVDDPQVALLIRLLFTTGMRISEALDLRPSDISKDNEIWLTETKFDKPRPVYVNDLLARELRSFRGGDQRIFQSKDGGRLDRKKAYYHIKKYLKAAGYPEYFPHCERHGYATELIARGANLAIVSKAMGHANVATTEIYTHLHNDDVRRMHQSTMPVV